jgi:hypothetical protein
MDVKKLFALMPVEVLKRLAMNHNIQSNIKAPSQQLKAELVKSLSDKYFELKGTTLLPVKNEKGLDIPWMDIPTIFKPKPPTKPQKVIETDRDIQEFQRLKALEEWAKQHIKVKQSKFDIAREKRMLANNKYTTEKEYELAIEKRRERKRKESEKKFEKLFGRKLGELPGEIKPKKVKEPEPEPEPAENPIIEKLNGLLNRYTYLNKISKIDKDAIEYYNNTLDRYSGIIGNYNKIKNSLTKNDKKTVDTLFNKIDLISDNDNFNDKFNE